MATQRAAIKALLTANATWLSTVGAANTKWWDEWGRTGLEPATATYDANGRLQICVVLKYGANTMRELWPIGALRFLQIYFYHDSSYETLLTVQNLARSILNRQTVVYDTGRQGYLEWVSDSAEFIADELGGAVGMYSRYALVHTQR